MGEDDIIELLWKNRQIIGSNAMSDKPASPPPISILPSSGSGGDGEKENAPLPQLPSPFPPHQNLFIHEDEMAYWLQHPHLYSDPLYSCIVSTSATQPQSSVSLAPPPPPSAPSDFPISQIIATRREENFMNFARLRENILPRAEPGITVVKESTQVGSNGTPTESCPTPATVIGGVPPIFSVPGLGWKEKAVAIETVAGTSGLGVCKVETEPVQIQPATETEDSKKKKREETIDEIEETKEARGSASRKRPRAAELHNIAERRRREKINEKMKVLQEVNPRCKKSDKASVLDDAIEYIKSLQMQVQMLSTGEGGMTRMMYAPNMQQFMTQMAMGMMGMNGPPFIPFPGSAFPGPAHMTSLGPNIQAFDPSRIHIPSQPSNPVSNQPQFEGYMNPYSQFVGLQQMQQLPPPPPPPLQNKTASQLNSGQASGSKEPEEQENQHANDQFKRISSPSTTRF